MYIFGISGLFMGVIALVFSLAWILNSPVAMFRLEHHELPLMDPSQYAFGFPPNLPFVLGGLCVSLLGIRSTVGKWSAVFAVLSLGYTLALFL